MRPADRQRRRPRPGCPRHARPRWRAIPGVARDEAPEAPDDTDYDPVTGETDGLDATEEGIRHNAEDVFDEITDSGDPDDPGSDLADVEDEDEHEDRFPEGWPPDRRDRE
ncbi:hypothetical protein ACFQ4K_31915 [Tistrella bauzanensis]